MREILGTSLAASKNQAIPEAVLTSTEVVDDHSRDRDHDKIIQMQ